VPTSCAQLKELEIDISRDVTAKLLS